MTILRPIRAWPVVLMLVMAASAVSAPVAAQERSVVVRGRVLDAAGVPLERATVQALGSLQARRSGSAGEFVLTLPAGEWRVVVSRLGARPDTLHLRLGGAPELAVEARLHDAPLRLEGLAVRAPAAAALAQVVTRESVRRVPPLGEADVFRAITLLPGVSQPNDLKGRIHLAGGASDETGVRLDGHPLQDPFHLLGLLGAFNVAALDRADVLIHHLPPALGGSLSGVVAMRTRAPSAAPLREATVSLLSGGVTLGRSGLPGGVDVLAAARTTYLDRVAASVAPDLPRAGFRDALVRLGRSWGGWRGELLGFTTNDRYADADFAEVAAYDPLHWGESMVGARLDREAAGARLAFRASYNVAGSHLDERGAGGANFIDSERGWLSAAAEGELSREAWRARGGVAVDAREHTQRWVARGLIDEVFSPNTPAEYEGTERVTVAAIHGEGSLRLGSCLTATLGARVSVTSEGAFPAPSALLTCEPRSGPRLEAVVEWRHQFAAQLEEPIEGSISPPIFLLARPRTADVAAVSTAWSSAWGELGAQLFARRYPDRTRLPARAPGAGRDDIGSDFPAFERVAGSAAGLALSGTASGRNRVAQGSYTFQRARETFDGSTTPTGWDAPHALSVLFSAALGRRWIGSTVYQARSGRATTPVRARIFEPDLRVPDSNSLLPRYLYGERNSIRVPAYHRLDLGVRRGWRARSADWTLSLQVLNVLMRENAVDYDWDTVFSDLRFRGGTPRAGRAGLPLVPSIGIEVAW